MTTAYDKSSLSVLLAQIRLEWQLALKNSSKAKLKPDVAIYDTDIFIVFCYISVS